MTTSVSQAALVDKYIHSFPLEVRPMLETIRETIRAEISGGQEVISYKMPAFMQNGRFVIYFAAWKNHISLYPFSAEMQKSLKEASKYKTSGKGTIQFPLDQPLPIPLIRKIIQIRLRENA